MTDPAPIRRHFVTIPGGRFGARQVHFRRAGQGPVLLLLHQSPLSSKDLEPTIDAWSRHYTCIAPDTPGYGASDPFGSASVEMDDIADAVVEFLDALGIGRCLVYGFHTGAMITAALAARHPGRVSAAVANGYVVLEPAMRAEILAHYLPPFAPQWDGSHLAWLWARLKEQTIFFPWYRKDAASRMSYDVPPPAALQRGALDFLRAGDEYRVGYRAAFAFDSAAAVQQVTVPLLVTAASSDPLHADLARLDRRAPAVRVASGGTPARTLAGALAFLQAHGSGAAPAVAAPAPLAGRLWQQTVEVNGGQLRLRRNSDAPGRTVVLLHAAAESAEQVAALARSFVGRRPVIAFDLPGHGESDDLFGDAPATIGRHAQAVAQALEALGLPEVDVIGCRDGGLVALELATAAPACVHALAMIDVPWFDDALGAELAANYCPAIEPDAHGGHLLQAWHQVRDQGLFWPWYRRTKAGILRGEPRVDPADVTARVLSLLRAGRRGRETWQAGRDFPLAACLAAVGVPTLLAAPQDGPLEPMTMAAAQANPACEYLRLAADPVDWGAALLGFCERS